MGGSTASIVMIVGSNAYFIYLMQHYVRTSGYQDIVAPLDDEVVTFAQKTKPAVIILESDLTEPASHEILYALKHDQLTRDFPVMVCSWQDEDENMLASEGDNYLQKPVTYDKFLSAMHELTQCPDT